MNYTEFVTGHYKNEPTEVFFDYFGLRNAPGNVLDMTEHRWFAGSYLHFPGQNEVRKHIKIHFKPKKGWNKFDKVIFGKEFTVGIEKTDDNHYYYFVYDNQKYEMFQLEQ